MEAGEVLIGYEVFYRRGHGLRVKDVQSFIICAVRPQKATREAVGFDVEIAPGVYGSSNPYLANKRLIVLSELAQEPCNMFFCMFGRQKNTQQAAFDMFIRAWMGRLPISISQYVLGI